MKYLVVIVAGLTDRPFAEKDNKTPLQLADTPNLDALTHDVMALAVLDIGNEADTAVVMLVGGVVQTLRFW